MRIKQRLFTRGEKRAFRELYKATKGFKKMPKTKNPRDVLRLKRLAKDFKRYSLGDIKNIDVDNAKELLNNAGLHQTANELEHVINKYSNKRALVRLKNIKIKIFRRILKKLLVPIIKGEIDKSSADDNMLKSGIIQIKRSPRILGLLVVFGIELLTLN